MLAGAGIVLLFAGCGSNTPDDVAKELVDCFRTADFDGVSKLSTGDFKKGAEALREVVKDHAKAEECKKEFSGKKIGTCVRRRRLRSSRLLTRTYARSLFFYVG